LARENVNFEELCEYARDAAYAAVKKKLPTKEHLVFAKNDAGQCDVSMFDFTSLYQSVNSSRIVERCGHKLFLSLVGDSLVEPFWPTGTGIARGFMSAFDTAWSIKHFAVNKRHPLEILSERETIYKLLTQTTHENLNKSYRQYSLEPSTRYATNLTNNLSLKTNDTVKHLYDTDGVVIKDKVANDLKPTPPLPSLSLNKLPEQRPPLAKPPITQPKPSLVASSLEKKPVTQSSFGKGQDMCHICGKCVYIMEKKTLLKYVIHRSCFKCEYCDRTLSDNFYKYNLDTTNNTCKHTPFTW